MLYANPLVGTNFLFCKVYLNKIIGKINILSDRLNWKTGKTKLKKNIDKNKSILCHLCALID
jgi:hypothetical protein